MKPRALRELLGALAVSVFVNGVLAILTAALRSQARSALHVLHLGFLSELWRFSISGSGGPKWWVLVGLLATACAYPVRALVWLRRWDDATTRAREVGHLAPLGAAASVAMLMVALLNIQVARAAAPDPSAKVDFSGVIRLSGESAGWMIVGAGLVLLAALWGAVGVLQARRGPREAAPKIVAIAAIVIAIGASLLRYGAELDAQFAEHIWGEWMPRSARYAQLLSRGEPLLQGRPAMLLVAAIGAAAILIAARRERGSAPPSPSRMKASVGLFALGLVAFALTRGVAHEAQHPPKGPVEGDYAHALPP